MNVTIKLLYYVLIALFLILAKTKLAVAAGKTIADT